MRLKVILSLRLKLFALRCNTSPKLSFLYNWFHLVHRYNLSLSNISFRLTIIFALLSPYLSMSLEAMCFPRLQSDFCLKSFYSVGSIYWLHILGLIFSSPEAIKSVYRYCWVFIFFTGGSPETLDFLNPERPSPNATSFLETSCIKRSQVIFLIPTPIFLLTSHRINLAFQEK